MENKVHISVVSPVYQVEKIVNELVKQVKQAVSTITEDFEIILVNDYSPDNAWQKITEESAKDTRVKGINFSRNFGQHCAITAGLNHAQGEWVVVMDCDLQDRPGEIPNLYRKAQEGYQSVFAQRIERNDSFIKRTLSRTFFFVFSYLTETKQDATVSNFGIYHCSVIQAVLSMKDQIRFFSTMVQWVGFKKVYLPVNHNNRFEGKSSYNFRNLFKLATNAIIAFSDKPLRLTVKTGFFISLLSFFIGCFYLIGYFSGTITVSGFTSLIISIWFLSGVIILLLGILGLYIGKIFEKVKERPNFIIQERLNF
ncbi:MAG: glycosyltransferase family 2 protein [Ignavibacteriaceae bacterium]|jgi:dolichol-phosphate mannosyltransferase